MFNHRDSLGEIIRKGYLLYTQGGLVYVTCPRRCLGVLRDYTLVEYVPVKSKIIFRRDYGDYLDTFELFDDYIEMKRSSRFNNCWKDANGRDLYSNSLVVIEGSSYLCKVVGFTGTLDNSSVRVINTHTGMEVNVKCSEVYRVS